MSVSDARHIKRLDAILHQRPAGRNIIEFAVETIKAERDENRELHEALRLGVAVVEDFMTNIKHCVLQDYGALNQFLIKSDKILGGR